MDGTYSSRWPLIGWIVLEFIRIFSMMICTIIAIIIWAVYMDDSKDTSYMIAVAVIGMMLISMLFNQGRRKVSENLRRGNLLCDGHNLPPG